MSAARPAANSITLRALVAFVPAAAFFFYVFVQRVSPSVMVGELMRDFAVGGAIVGTLASLYLYAYAGLQLPVGLMLDRLGPRRLLTGAALFCGAGGVIFATADGLWMAYLGRTMIGAGAAASWVGALVVTAQWIPAARFALFTGIVQSFGMVGAVFGQAPLAGAVLTQGWRATMLVVGLIGLVFALVMWLAIEDRPSQTAAAGTLRADLRAVTANRETWLCGVIGGSMTAAMLSFGGLWAVPYLGVAYGFDRPTAAWSASLLFIGWGIASPAFGLISDRVRRRRGLLLIGTIGAVATILPIALLSGLPIWLLWALLFMHGAFASSMIIVFASVREHNRVGAAGAAMGVVNTFVVGSGALFQPLIGIVLDLMWDGAIVDGARIYSLDAYRAALVVLPVAAVIGMTAAFLHRETYGRQTG
jgi:MFS family permease